MSDVDSERQGILIDYLDQLKVQVQSGEVDGLFLIAGLESGAYSTSCMGKMDPFSVFGFSMFVQMKKLMEHMQEHSMPEESRIVQ